MISRVGTGTEIFAEVWNGNQSITGWINNTYTEDGNFHIYILHARNTEAGLVISLYRLHHAFG
jgi:hypothetical protein